MIFVVLIVRMQSFLSIRDNACVYSFQLQGTRVSLADSTKNATDIRMD